jgi:hypothetical protein
VRRSVARHASSTPDRRIPGSGDPPFVEVARETAGLPPGVAARWFRSNLARPLLDGPLPEPEAGVTDVPSLREAVGAALAAVQPKLRAGAAAHVDRALAEAGI